MGSLGGKYSIPSEADFLPASLRISGLERTMNVLKRAYAQFYWQTWSNVNPALTLRIITILCRVSGRRSEKTQNYLKEDLDFVGKK